MTNKRQEFEERQPAAAVEPTPEIISAMHAAYWGKPVLKTYENMTEESRELWRKTYRAMRAAAAPEGLTDEVVLIRSVLRGYPQPTTKESRPFAEVAQINQGRYFTCLAAVGVDAPAIGTKVYLAAPTQAAEAIQCLGTCTCPDCNTRPK